MRMCVPALSSTSRRSSNSGIAALMAYKSQYANQDAGSALFVPEEEIRERTFAEARHYGLLAGVKYGEPFVQKEVGLVDDLTLLPVQSI